MALYNHLSLLRCQYCMNGGMASLHKVISYEDKFTRCQNTVVTGVLSAHTVQMLCRLCRCKRTVLISIPSKFCLWHIGHLIQVGVEVNTAVSHRPKFLLSIKTQSLIRQKCLLLYLALSNWRVPGPIQQSVYAKGMKSCSAEINRSFTAGSSGTEVSLSFNPIHLRGVQICALVLH